VKLEALGGNQAGVFIADFCAAFQFSNHLLFKYARRRAPQIMDGKNKA
jgi:hypothetical protein